MRNSERSTFAAERLAKNDKRPAIRPAKSTAQIETTLHVVNSVTVRLECGLIAKLRWPDIRVVWMGHVPADASFVDATLQIRDICSVLQSLQFCQLLAIRLPEHLTLSRPPFDS